MFTEEREEKQRVEIERLRGAVRELQEENEALKAEQKVLQNLFEDITDEMERQDKKWGKQEHQMSIWMTILTEEHGEIAKAICDLYNSPNREEKKKHFQQVKLELVQTIAVGMQWLNYLKENEYRAKTIRV